MREKKGTLLEKISKELGLDKDYEDIYEEEDPTWFHNRFIKTIDKATLKKNVKDKLCTDKKLTFEEYTTLLEIVTDTFRDSFNCDNGRFDIIFRERRIEDKNIERERDIDEE